MEIAWFFFFELFEIHLNHPDNLSSLTRQLSFWKPLEMYANEMCMQTLERCLIEVMHWQVRWIFRMEIERRYCI